MGAFAGWVTCLVVLANAGNAGAQSVQGVVTGSVSDSSGGVVRGADLTLTNDGTGVDQQEKSDADGNYRFSLVPPGGYTLAVKAPGFAKKEVQGIVVDASQVTPVNVTLSVATAQTTVPVVNVEPNENMEFACPPSIPPLGGQRTSCVGRRRVGGLQIPSHAPFGEPRATAPTRRPASLGEAA